jgi:hypothetical protein
MTMIRTERKDLLQICRMRARIAERDPSTGHDLAITVGKPTCGTDPGQHFSVMTGTSQRLFAAGLDPPPPD